jgi:xylulose-5-phosphate/fructose-6-phosphate phosphoketolase
VLSHGNGAVFDNPDLIAVYVVGDGEAETGPLATGWHSNKFLNPVTDGAVLPVLHLNGYKIASPTVLARIPEDELEALFEGYGYQVHLVAGDDPEPVHRRLAATLDAVIEQIGVIQQQARDGGGPAGRPRWPARGVDARLPAGGTVRRPRRAGCGTGRAGPARRPPDGRQPARHQPGVRRPDRVRR